MNNKYTIDNDQELIIFKNGYGRLQFQHKPVNEVGVNGLQINDVINALIERMEFLNGLHADEYNENTINYLELAKESQIERDNDREERNVEGYDLD